MTVSLKIDNIERSDVVDFKSLRRLNKVNNDPDTLKFRILRGGSKTYIPSANDEIVLTVNGTKEFGGVIVRIQDTIVGNDLVRYDVTAKDFSQFLNRELVTQRYENTTVEAVINDLITNFATGFTDNNVNAPQTVDSISFNRLNLSQCLQKLAESVAYSWYVDYDKDIHFFAKTEEPAPFNLTDDDTSTDFGKYIYKSLTKKDDLSQIRNKIIVQGGEKVGATRTITKSGADLSTEGILNLEYKFDSKPTVEVDSVVQTVGLDFVDDDAGFDVMWNFNEKYLRWTAGNIPGSGAVLEVTGDPLFPIIVQVPDENSIVEFGVYEFAIKDRTIRSDQEAIERAIAEINAYAQTISEGSFETYEPGLRAGQIINIEDTFRNISESVLIQEVTMSPRTPDGSQLLHRVTFATLKTIGIIDFMQKQLLDEEILEGESETLLSYIQISDLATANDTLPAPIKSTGPYYWSPVTTGTAFKWNFGKWT